MSMTHLNSFNLASWLSEKQMMGGSEGVKVMQPYRFVHSFICCQAHREYLHLLPFFSGAPSRAGVTSISGCVGPSVFINDVTAASAWKSSQTTCELLGEALVTLRWSPDLSFIYSLFWLLYGALRMVLKPLSSNSLILSLASHNVMSTTQSSKVILTSPSSIALPTTSHPSLGS